VGAIVEKLMTITRAELEASLAKLDPAARLDAAGHARVRIAGVAAALTFEALPKRRVGGLISLPQARVTLAFDGTSADERAGFLRRFDIAFQRGGG
jgi:hypothetical protein